MNITRKQLIHDFTQLGLKNGDAVLVHSALSAIGRVEDGADGVIDALLEVLGNEGTLLMPALSSGIFDPAESPSKVGIITETFRRRQGVLRSFHPSHSVTAFGRLAEELTREHLNCPTACGEGTPYAKLMDAGGKILLLGVDQDRNTSLHTLEAIMRLPYLKTITREYRDPADGEIKTLEIHEYPGPHRDFIGLDRLFREAGIMRVGKAGKAVCRLIDAAGMRDIGLRLLRKDATAILCDNPNCQDCVTQRAAVKRQRLGAEDFLLSVVSDAAGNSMDEALAALSREGIRGMELRRVDGREIADFSVAEAESLGEKIRERGFEITAVSATDSTANWLALLDAAAAVKAPAAILPLAAWSPEVARHAQEKGVSLRLENTGETSAECLEKLAAISEPALAFNPANFAAGGEKPFLRVYKTPLKRTLTQLYLADGTFAGNPTPLTRGNGEVKELVSILRCASFGGPLTIKDTAGLPPANFLEGFWKMMDSL